MLLIGNINTDGRVQKEIATLKAAGHRVTLIQWAYTGSPADRGRLGIDVIEYPHVLAKSAARNFLRQLQFNAWALGRLREVKPDIVQCNDLNTLPAGALYAKRARIVFDAHELFPESHDGARKAAWSLIERLTVPRCHAFIQPERHRRAFFARKHGLREDDIALIENFPSGRYAFSGRDRLRERFGIPRDKLILLYTGVLGPGRELENMIQATALLDGRYVLVLLGPAFKGYEKELEALAAAQGLADRVFFHPPIPNADMLDHIAAGDIGLVFYKNTSLNNFWCASNKLYELILCGKPVITNDYPGLLEVVGKNRLGACLKDTSPETIAAAVRALPAAPSPASGTDCPYLWERQEAAYLGLFA